MNEELRIANKLRQALGESARLDGPRGEAIAERPAGKVPA